MTVQFTIIFWTVPKSCSHLLEGNTLHGFCKDISPHCLHGTVFYTNLSTVDLAFDKKISHMDVFCFFKMEAFPLFLGFIALTLSCIIIFVEIVKPWASRKYLVKITCVRASSTPVSSAYVELLKFNFCLHEKFVMAPSPSTTIPPE